MTMSLRDRFKKANSVIAKAKKDFAEKNFMLDFHRRMTEYVTYLYRDDLHKPGIDAVIREEVEFSINSWKDDPEMLDLANKWLNDELEKIAKEAEASSSAAMHYNSMRSRCR